MTSSHCQTCRRLAGQKKTWCAKQTAQETVLQAQKAYQHEHLTSTAKALQGEGWVLTRFSWDLECYPDQPELCPLLVGLLKILRFNSGRFGFGIRAPLDPPSKCRRCHAQRESLPIQPSLTRNKRGSCGTSKAPVVGGTRSSDHVVTSSRHVVTR